MIQVKARDRAAGSDRERSWLDKEIKTAANQARGTLRNLTYSGPMSLTNARGDAITVDAKLLDWVRVVVVDHPGLDGYVPARRLVEDVKGIGGVTSVAVVLHRRDWEFLFDQLKSTYAVLEYLHRVQKIGDQVALGHEGVRYYELAAADAGAPPAHLDERLIAEGGSQSEPLLPMPPAEFGDIVRVILEDIATSPTDGTISREGVLNTLAAIDAAPVALRREMGETLTRWLEDVALGDPDEYRWHFRSLTWMDRPNIIVGVCSRFDSDVYKAFAGYVSLRHQQLGELVPALMAGTTVGVLLTPRTDSHRLWDTTAVRVQGDLDLEPQYRASIERLFGQRGDSVVLTDAEEPLDELRGHRGERNQGKGDRA